MVLLTYLRNANKRGKSRKQESQHTPEEIKRAQLVNDWMCKQVTQSLRLSRFAQRYRFIPKPMMAKMYQMEESLGFKRASTVKGYLIAVGDIVALKGGEPYNYFLVTKGITETRIKPTNDYGQNINVHGQYLEKDEGDRFWRLANATSKIKYGIIISYSGIPVVLSTEYVTRDEQNRFLINHDLEKELVEKRKEEKETVLYYYKFMRHTGMPQNLSAVESLVLDRVISEDEQDASAMTYSQEQFSKSQERILGIAEAVMEAYPAVREYRNENDYLCYLPEAEKTTQQNQMMDET